MDPLSISASALTLIGTACTITRTLYNVSQAVRGADSRVTALYNELTSLATLLTAIERTLKGCKGFEPTAEEEVLLGQSQLALGDCRRTLDELEVLVDKLKGGSGVQSFGNRIRKAADLNLHGSELADFQDRVRKSSWALQTMLHTITVSLSMRSNTSQETILFELERLKMSIHYALGASYGPKGSFSRDVNLSDARVAHNLRGLANAAKHFHSVVSLRASTILGSECTDSQSRSSAPASVFDDLPSAKRARVEEFIQQNYELDSEMQDLSHMLARHDVSRCEQGPAQPGHGSPLSTRKCAELGGAIDDFHDVEEVRQVISCLEDLASEQVELGTISTATQYLSDALKLETQAALENSALNPIRIQIAYSYFFQREWRKAMPIVMNLSELAVTDNTDQNSAISRLLHTLSLAYLSIYEFEAAICTCRKVLERQRLSLHDDIKEVCHVNEAIGLMQMIYNMMGKPVRAEVYRRKLPQDFIYEHPADYLDFLLKPSKVPVGDSDPAMSKSRNFLHPSLNFPEIVATWRALPKLFNRSDTKDGRSNSPTSLSQTISNNEKMNGDTDKILSVEIENETALKCWKSFTMIHESHLNSPRGTKRNNLRRQLADPYTHTHISDGSETISVVSSGEGRSRMLNNLNLFRKRSSFRRKASRRYLKDAFARIDQWFTGGSRSSNRSISLDDNGGRILEWIRGQDQVRPPHYKTEDSDDHRRNTVYPIQTQLLRQRLQPHGDLYEYFGPQAVTGPYTECAFEPSIVRIPSRGVSLIPHRPDDVLAPIELDSSSIRKPNQFRSSIEDPVQILAVAVGPGDVVFELEADNEYTAHLDLNSSETGSSMDDGQISSSAGPDLIVFEEDMPRTETYSDQCSGNSLKNGYMYLTRSSTKSSQERAGACLSTSKKLSQESTHPSPDFVSRQEALYSDLARFAGGSRNLDPNKQPVSSAAVLIGRKITSLNSSYIEARKMSQRNPNSLISGLTPDFSKMEEKKQCNRRSLFDRMGLYGINDGQVLRSDQRPSTTSHLRHSHCKSGDENDEGNETNNVKPQEACLPNDDETLRTEPRYSIRSGGISKPQLIGRSENHETLERKFSFEISQHARTIWLKETE